MLAPVPSLLSAKEFLISLRSIVRKVPAARRSSTHNATAAVGFEARRRTRFPFFHRILAVLSFYPFPHALPEHDGWEPSSSSNELEKTWCGRYRETERISWCRDDIEREGDWRTSSITTVLAAGERTWERRFWRMKIWGKPKTHEDQGREGRQGSPW